MDNDGNPFTIKGQLPLNQNNLMKSFPSLSTESYNTMESDLAASKQKLTERFINSINNNIHQQESLAKPSKRDRPLSSYFDSPTEELDEIFKLGEFDFQREDIENDSPLVNKKNSQKSTIAQDDINQIQQHPMNQKTSRSLLRKFKPDNSSDSNISDSPLSNRKPFKNITNFVNNFEFPIKSKISLSTKNFTKSVTLVAKYSQSELDKIFSHNNDHGLTSYLQSHPSLEDTDVDEDDDANNTTINDEHLLQNIDNTDVDEGNDSLEDLLDSPTHQSLSNKTSIQSIKNPILSFSNVSNTKSFANFERSDSKCIRRIHSMYQTSKEKQTYNNIMTEDNSHLPKSSIRTFKVDNDLLPRIDENEMYKILSGEYSNEFDEFVIIDCRFNYEYDGGHIDGSLNISSQQDLEEKLINSRGEVSTENLMKRKKQLIIFHCEFSIFRGPTMASHLRKCDRILNRDNYPLLSYPDIVILEGGYKRFYDSYRHRCFPQGYIEMKDINYQEHCEYELDKVRQANKLTRAKSHNHFSLPHNNSSNNSSIYLSNQHSNSFTTTTRPFSHNRSSSYTTVTSHSENLKILKRQRSSSKVQLNLQPSISNSNLNLHSRSLSNFDLTSKFSRPSSLSHGLLLFNSPKQGHNFSSSSSSLLVDEDFQPPPALFRSASGLTTNGNNNNNGNSTSNSSERPSLSSQFTHQSLSSVSISSARSSISSDPYSSAFSSSDSLNEFQSSPIGDYSEFFDTNQSKCSSAHTSYQSNLSSYSNYAKYSNNSFNDKPNSNSLLNPMIRKPVTPIPEIPTQKLTSSLQLPHVKQVLKELHNKSNSTNSVYTTSTTTTTNTNNNYSYDKSVSSNKSKVIQINNSVHSGFTFPNSNGQSSGNSSSKTKTTGLNRISTKSNISLGNSSPIVSSPLSTATPISTIESALSNNPSSIIDPINDAPVDFGVPINNTHSSHMSNISSAIGGNYGIAKVYSNSNRYYGHSRKHSNSLFGSAGGGLYNYLSLDIDEADEEDDEVGALR